MRSPECFLQTPPGVTVSAFAALFVFVASVHKPAAVFSLVVALFYGGNFILFLARFTTQNWRRLFSNVILFPPVVYWELTHLSRFLRGRLGLCPSVVVVSLFCFLMNPLAFRLPDWPICTLRGSMATSWLSQLLLPACLVVRFREFIYICICIFLFSFTHRFNVFFSLR